MPKVVVWKDERYPDYSFSLAGDPHEKISIEVPQEKLDIWYNINRQYEQVQLEMEELYEHSRGR